jgi:transcription elongation GreA/GreB family factor
MSAVNNNLMTSRTRELLKEEIKRLELSLIETLKQSGEASDSVDKWHDEEVKNLVQEELYKREALHDAKVAYNTTTIIRAPVQNEIVDVGHLVSVLFLGSDGQMEKEMDISILGQWDVLLRSHETEKNKKHTVISPESLLGKTILGSKLGEIKNFTVFGKSSQVKIKDIKTSPLL